MTISNRVITARLRALFRNDGLPKLTADAAADRIESLESQLAEAGKDAEHCILEIRKAALNAANEWSNYVDVDSAPMTCELFVARAIDAIKDCLTVAPTFNQAEHDTMVEKGTQAWADPADYPERCKADPPQSFQLRVEPWMMGCFGPVIAADTKERNHRFLEESLELVQSCGATASEAHQLVDYVYGRPIGEKSQEVGGVMVTLAALCLAQEIDMHAAGETELARIWTKIVQIRAKQAAKPKHSPLPEDPLQSLADQAQELNMGYGEPLRDTQQSKIRAEELSDDDIDEIWCAQSVAGLDPYQSIVEWNVQLRRRFARSLLSKVRQ